MQLRAQLDAQLREKGAVTVAEYMARANAHYYATRDPLGKDGDFTTAPEISQVFGELIGAWLASQWSEGRVALVELGPGRGTLMRDMLRATRNVQGFHASAEIHLVETSPVLRARQRETLKDASVTWHDSLDTLPDMPWLLVANEFFDALPIHQHVYAHGEWRERVVNADWQFSPAGDAIREECPAAMEIVQRIAQQIETRGGAALIVDYGYTQGKGDTLQAVKNHQPANPLKDPGEADLTAHVDFAALKKAAGKLAHGPVTQGAFLRMLGAELRAMQLCTVATPQQRRDLLSGLERLISPAQMGELFKVLAITAADMPEGF